MFCTGCGSKINDDAVRCDSCGKPTKNINAPRAAAGAPAKKQAAPPQGKPANAAKSSNAMEDFKRAAQLTSKPPAKKAAAPPPETESHEPPPDPVFSPIKQQTGINFGRAFGYFTQAPDWLKKYLTLLLLSLVPILNFTVMGYYVQLINNTSKGMDSELPEIDIANQFVSGALFCIALLLFLIPASVIAATLFFFAKIPVVNIFAFVLIPFYYILLATYLTGAFVLSAMEGNPWVIFRFPQCMMAVQNSLMDVVLVGIVISVLSVMSNFVITIPLMILCGGHLAGQLGRVLRTHTRF